MEDDSSIRTRCFLAVPQGEGRRGETGRLALIMHLKFMYRNAHVQWTRRDAQNDRMNQRQKEWNDLKMCAWPVKPWMPTNAWMGPNRNVQNQPVESSVGARGRYIILHGLWEKPKPAKNPPRSHVPSVLRYIQPIVKERWYNKKVGSF